MGKRLLRLFIALLGTALTIGAVVLVDNQIVAWGGVTLTRSLELWSFILVYVIVPLAFGIIFYILYPRMAKTVRRMLHLTEESLSKMPLLDIAFAVLGLIVGLLVALLLSTLVNMLPIPWLATPLSVVLYVLCGYLGVFISLRKRMDIRNVKINFPPLNNLTAGHSYAKPKLLDTSVIIDGRILDICMTGVIEGTLIVPGFVLKELRHIADSSDSLKRGRGRRGLDILQKMQKELALPVKVEEKDYEDVLEVDLKLLKLAQDLNGVVVTNDYNLNKVAGVQNVPVFNINDLANAIKPVVLPGEELSVSIIKEGKEAGQGIGYLDDGTMIVIDGGKRLIGEQTMSVVTSVLQTSAGRMIFARLK